MHRPTVPLLVFRRPEFAAWLDGRRGAQRLERSMVRAFGRRRPRRARRPRTPYPTSVRCYLRWGTAASRYDVTVLASALAPD